MVWRFGFSNFQSCPTVNFIFGEKDFPWSLVDCEIAVENMTLTADGIGVEDVIIDLSKPAFYGENADELRIRLECSGGYDFVVALTLGM